MFTERTDHHYAGLDNDILALLICGVFESRDNLIYAWRDYFDPMPMLKMFDTSAVATPRTPTIVDARH